jgi:hypothetical protein
MHDLWSIIGIGTGRMQPHTGPYRHQAAKHFVASEAEPAIDALGLAGRE